MIQLTFHYQGKDYDFCGADNIRICQSEKKEAKKTERFPHIETIETTKQDYQLDQWKLNDGTRITLKSYQGGVYAGTFDHDGSPITFDSHGYVTLPNQDHRYLKTSRNHQDKWE